VSLIEAICDGVIIAALLANLALLYWTGADVEQLLREVKKLRGERSTHDQKHAR